MKKKKALKGIVAILAVTCFCFSLGSCGVMDKIDEWTDDWFDGVKTESTVDDKKESTDDSADSKDETESTDKDSDSVASTPSSDIDDSVTE